MLQQADSDLRNQLFDAIDEHLKPEVLAELEVDGEDEVLEGLSVAEISDLAEDTPPDEAADVMAEAILRAVRLAEGLPGIPSVSDLGR